MTSMEAGSSWKVFLRRHWLAATVFGVAAVLILVGSVYVFLWFASDAQSSGLVPATLGLWTMANLVAFILNAIFWELFLIGIPGVVAGIIGWQWWRRMPEEERRGYRFEMRSRRKSGGGGGSLLFFIVFCVKVYLDGKWNVPIGTWNLDYVVSSVVLILALAAIIFGIPGTIVGIWWVRRETKKP